MIRLEGFQKPVTRGNSKPVRLAVVSQTGGLATCNCGWAYVHNRDKIRENAIDRHLLKRHGGQGIRL